MLLQSLSLKNIRSYVDAKIEFPDKYLLLAGDIGSGKTTVLLAIEFALFGLLRTELPGNALLRNGRHVGEVELAFKLDDKEIIIKRVLKRNGDTVSQDAGSLSINGEKKELTASELKGAILDLFGYPKSMVTKSKLVYRYTVYTPQEQMKAVLTDKPEDRMNVLRQVFDIDKFKRVKENTNVVLKDLRLQSKELEGRTADLAAKEELYENHKREITEVKEHVTQAQQYLEVSKTAVSKAEANVKLLETQAEQVALAKTQHALAQNTLENAATTKTRLQQEHDASLQEQQQISKELTPIDVSQLPQQRTVLQQAESDLYKLGKELGEQEAIHRVCQDTITKITQLDNCPVCQQPVTDTHKHAVTMEQQNKQQTIQSKITNLNQEQQQLTSTADTARKQVDQLQRLQERALQQASLQQRAEHLSQRTQEILQEQAQLDKDVLAAQQKQQELKALLNTNIEGFEQARSELQKAQQRSQEDSLKEQELRTKQDMLQRMITELEGELEDKRKARVTLEGMNAKQAWLKNEFVGLVDLIEQHMMARLHAQFNDLFQQWFGLLIDDNLQAQLDDTFTPVIVQNGYEVSVDHLSGGEKTACALAYRLALNRVINDIIHTIRTKDLLILDEPTDGFSRAQLERLGQVLNDIEARQVLIVSHEQTMESYVDSVISLNKNDHVTAVG
ncbi:MAG: AAA family ATPase [Candidatus Woesearchaeota archaeon]|nr:AAA family ATPase [Candidatus Woesearchaeota archaeon]MDP7199053.1 AAA family ATPase [Candidatus Woesearchaeota archaeon]MDP7467763.1 AAA family ATPase [Candidatus Woesearchaeota archaeon]MDP7646466.1 AAA family ATPase [Candidatus Woesearchaeota archaeon]